MSSRFRPVDGAVVRVGVKAENIDSGEFGAGNNSYGS